MLEISNYQYTLLFFSNQTVNKQLSLRTEFVEQCFRAESSSVTNSINFQVLQKCFWNVQLLSIKPTRLYKFHKNCFDIWPMAYNISWQRLKNHWNNLGQTIRPNQPLTGLSMKKTLHVWLLHTRLTFHCHIAYDYCENEYWLENNRVRNDIESRKNLASEPIELILIESYIVSGDILESRLIGGRLN